MLSLSDNTNGQRFTTRQVDAAATLSSAEVVAEAPSSRDGLLPLADFGAVHFAGARANGRPLGDFASSRVIMTSGSRTLASASALSRTGTALHGGLDAALSRSACRCARTTWWTPVSRVLGYGWNSSGRGRGARGSMLW